ncbi:hypothetical protein R078138_00429 [Convivina praedatoris]|uniref:NADH dehydrogenase subunit 4L n=1 Tax=Convivina praedatoris TaxID=2880963 RepID=A0ABM9D2A8_9LACO|nr:hypothetical protein LMG032447_00419 [Convivina sp. LMG 32447]CAH1851867.1 hypothetical protein R078138_00429 [Convivina sp. LMG 32447]CAH1853017.1 hypothetical protein R077815_00688 [Convivina sp. LMG 32447]
MNKMSTIAIIISLLLMFVSLVSWILQATDFSLITANLATVILLVAFVWTNRHQN